MAAVLSLVACIASVGALNEASDMRAEMNRVDDAPMAAAPAEEPEPEPAVQEHGALGEKMNSFARRFAGLWYAGKAGNTALANYELKEMGEVIKDVQSMDKVENGVLLNGVIGALGNTQLKAVGTALDAKDPVAFERAYRETVKMCNACHVATAHEFIRIDIPERKPVTNRLYEPAED